MANNARTFCPRLWEEFFIERDGKVYACCNHGPSELGSLHSSSLTQIANGDTLRNFRAQSLQGQLNCYSGCKLLADNRLDEVVSSVNRDYARYRRLKILFSESCNIACIMCWQDHTDRQRLTADLLIQQVDLTPFESVELQGGEPLVIADARRFFDYAALKGKAVSFLTNGLSISDEWAKKIALHSRLVHFSLNAATKETHEVVNAGSSWEKVWRNIERVKEWRRVLNSRLRLLGHFTIVAANVHEVSLFIRSFYNSFDEVSFFYDGSVIDFLEERPGLRSSIAEELETLTVEVLSLSDFSRIRLAELGLLKHHKT